MSQTKRFVSRAAPRCAGALAVLASLGAGCGGTSAGEPSDDSSAALTSCIAETGALTYAPNVAVMSTSGAFKAMLVESEPGPPIKGTNTWTVKIVDANGTPQDGLTITPSANMPLHNHPPSVMAVVTPKGGGVYELTPVYLFMAGLWDVTLTWVPPDGAKESVIFPVCVG
jgi:hypothetical protein